jgi:hypothetical protein
LAGIEHDIAEAKKSLAALNADVAKATTLLERLQVECKTAENRRDAVMAETAASTQACVAARDEMSNIRRMLNSIELRRSA